MIHYAGHGIHDEKNSDESGIAFWEKSNRGGQVEPMPIRILRNLLTHSDTRFFYLSCCVGAKTEAEASVRLDGNDFEGILEGLSKSQFWCAWVSLERLGCRGQEIFAWLSTRIYLPIFG